MTFDPPDPIPVLAQTGPKTFELRNEITYYSSTGEKFTFPKDPAERSYDLTSIPGFLTWLIPKYGKHTVAVLLHDDLVETTTPADERSRYDSIFRDALGELEVPFLRRWTLWAGTNIGTMQKRRGLRKYASWLWLLVLITASGLFWWNRLATITDLPAMRLGPVDLWWQPIIAMFLAAALLVPDWMPIGIIGPAMALLLLPATVVVLITLAVYMAAEWLIKIVLRMLNRSALRNRTPLRVNDVLLRPPKTKRAQRRKEFFSAAS